ncbi:hypothetical protein VTO42DRAFT_8053 [Malbranchea cinnamomea]
MPTNHLSPLERLPTELLHRVFFLSFEFNLPRASLALASALSSEVIYTWLVRLAFSSRNTSSETGLFVHPFLPIDYFSLDDQERAELQTEILKCRWCTARLIRKCQREYVEHVLTRKCSDLVMSEEDAEKLKDLGGYWDDMNRFDSRPPGRRGKGELVVPTRDKSTGRVKKLAIWFNFGAVQIREQSPIVHEADVFRLPCCVPTEPCRMPDRLLRAPWTEEKFELLTLFSTEAYIDEDNCYERSKMVLRRLIIDRDFATFERLLSLHIRVKVYAYPLRWPVRPNHFRLAARCAEGDNDPFLRYLFTYRRDEIPSHDSSIKALMMRYDQQRHRMTGM